MLVVEDNDGDALLIEESLVDRGGFSLTRHVRLVDALHALQQRSFDVALVDLSLPDACGLDAVTRVASIDGGLPVLVMTGNPDHELAVQATQAGAQGYLVKGMGSFASLGLTVRCAIETEVEGNTTRASGSARFFDWAFQSCRPRSGLRAHERGGPPQ